MYSRINEYHEDTEDRVKTDSTDLNHLYKGLLKYCRFLSQNKWDGEDIAQEAMLKAIQSYKYKAELSSSLLKKIAYNQWIDITRKRRKEVLKEQISDDQPYENKAVMEVSDFLLQKLTPKQAIIFLLKEGFNYTAKEIAEMIQSNELAVKSALHRAKKRLADNSENPEHWSSEKYWNPDEYSRLKSLFYHSLEVHDPAVLIRYIPRLLSHVSHTAAPFMSIKSFSPPASPLSMAA